MKRYVRYISKKVYSEVRRSLLVGARLNSTDDLASILKEYQIPNPFVFSISFFGKTTTISASDIYKNKEFYAVFTDTGFKDLYENSAILDSYSLWIASAILSYLELPEETFQNGIFLGF